MWKNKPRFFFGFFLFLLVCSSVNTALVSASDTPPGEWCWPMAGCYDAAPVSVSVPSPILCNSKHKVTITMKNTGEHYWGSPYGGGCVYLHGPGGAIPVARPAVLSGQTRAFTFDITAPAMNGTYLWRWTMYRGYDDDPTGHTFGTWAEKEVTVVGDCLPPIDNPEDDADFISQQIPSYMLANKTYLIHITMKNTGTTTWAGNYKLGYKSTGPSSPWSITRVELHKNVAPGQRITFNFRVRAPTTNGTYNLQWQMAKEEEDTKWFGEASTNVAVNVVEPSDDNPIEKPKVLVLFVGGAGGDPVQNFLEFNSAFYNFKAQFSDDLGFDLDILYADKTEFGKKNTRELADSLNQKVLNLGNLDSYYAAYIITHSWGYDVTKTAVLKCHNPQVISETDPDVLGGDKQTLQDFYNKAHIVSISPILGGEHLAKLYPTDTYLPISALRNVSEADPAGDFQRKLFDNDQPFKDNTVSFETYIVIGDPHLKGIWAYRKNALVGDKPWDIFADIRDAFTDFVEKNETWYRNFEREKSNTKHVEYPNEEHPNEEDFQKNKHTMLLSYDPLITEAGKKIFGDDFYIIDNKKSTKIAAKTTSSYCNAEHNEDINLMWSKNDIAEMCNHLDAPDPSCIPTLTNENLYTRVNFEANYYRCLDLAEPCEVPGEELVIGNLRYYCGGDHLPHLKKNAEEQCETGNECLSGMCGSGACYGSTPEDAIPVFNPKDDITAIIGSPIQFTVSATHPLPGTLTYSAIHLPGSATFENRIFKWTPTLIGKHHALFKVTNGKFVDYLIVEITVVAPVYDAAYGYMHVKTDMYLNKSYPVRVTMQNTGNTCWRKQDGYKLGLYNPQDSSPWNITRVELDDTDIVIPGIGYKTFTFDIQSIATGNHNLQWRMIKEDGASSTWFGETTDNFVIDVAEPDLEAIGNDAEIIGYGVEEGPLNELIQGKIYNAWVKIKNTGKSTWTKEDGYKLGSQNLENNNDWGLRRVELDRNIPPTPDDGTTNVVIFKFPIRATQTGLLNFSWQMVHESVEWFGNIINQPVNVVSPDNHAAFVEYRDVPETMRPGQVYYVSVVMRNTGNTQWRKQDHYRLGYFNMGGGSPWGINRVELNEGETIKKNQNKTFDFTIVAPTTSGEYHFQWLMVHEGIGWFGQDSEYKVIKVHSDNIYCHSADTNKDWKISLSELLRVSQLMNSGEYHCAESTTEDGYVAGAGSHTCEPHDADTNKNWKIDFNELLRITQFYNSNGYSLQDGTEDGFAPNN